MSGVPPRRLIPGPSLGQTVRSRVEAEICLQNTEDGDFDPGNQPLGQLLFFCLRKLGCGLKNS